MPQQKQKSLGFTLIELLVVIVIISLLSSVVFASLKTARVKARDARRVADLKQIQLALELYFDSNRVYPPISGWALSCNSTWDTLQTALAPYIPKLPKDQINTSCAGPWNNNYYTYAYGYNTASYPGKYDLVAQLENKTDDKRCQVKCWRFHTAGGERPWCQNGPGTCNGVATSYNYSIYLYADH